MPQHDDQSLGEGDMFKEIIMKFWPTIEFVDKIDRKGTQSYYARQKDIPLCGICILWKDSQNIEIQVLKEKHIRQQIFILCHELGHWLVFRTGNRRWAHNLVERFL